VRNDDFLSDGAANVAAALVHLTALESLAMSGNKLGSDGLQALMGAVTRLTGLTSLDLGTNDALSDGVEDFSIAITRLVCLCVLNLGGNKLGSDGLKTLMGAVTRAAIVVTTSTWCSLDTWNTGNEESHTLRPFKEWVCGFKLPCKPGSLNHNCRFPNRVAEDRHDIQSSLRNTLHVK
jgi:hypothetical protein